MRVIEKSITQQGNAHKHAAKGDTGVVLSQEPEHVRKAQSHPRSQTICDGCRKT